MCYNVYWLALWHRRYCCPLSRHIKVMSCPGCLSESAVCCLWQIASLLRQLPKVHQHNQSLHSYLIECSVFFCNLICGVADIASCCGCLSECSVFLQLDMRRCWHCKLLWLFARGTSQDYPLPTQSSVNHLTGRNFFLSVTFQDVFLVNRMQLCFAKTLFIHYINIQPATVFGWQQNVICFKLSA